MESGEATLKAVHGRNHSGVRVFAPNPSETAFPKPPCMMGKGLVVSCPKTPLCKNAQFVHNNTDFSSVHTWYNANGDVIKLYIAFWTMFVLHE